MEVQAEEEQAFLARQQAALSGLKDPTRSPTTRNQASPGPVIQVIPFINGACSSCCVPNQRTTALSLIFSLSL